MAGKNNLLPITEIPPINKIGTDLQLCILCQVTIAFLIVVIENQQENDWDDKKMVHTPYQKKKDNN